ncbi:MAG: BON domain-containing protein [Acidobacteriia bacterium]|nr:BON domain-containing protein [Terriglobia bacterium]
MNANSKRIPTIVLGTLVAASALSAQTKHGVPERASERIAREVRHEIVMLPYYGVFDNITFAVQGYNVTLMGYVTRPVLKKDAENVVKRIEGVEQVVNRIEVLPPSSMDDGLRLQLYRAIYGHPPLEKYAMPVIKPIRIIVNSGRVTLEGVVDSEADKNIVNLRANGVPGIFSVTNNLVVVKSK